MLFRAQSCVKTNLLSHQERTVQIRLGAHGVVCGVWYGLWPLVQYSSTMHFRFGSLYRVARAAARVLPPFLVAVVVAPSSSLPSTTYSRGLQRLLHGRHVGYHRTRCFDVFMSTSSMNGLFLNRSLSLSLASPFSAGDNTRVKNKTNMIGFTLKQDTSGLIVASG